MKPAMFSVFGTPPFGTNSRGRRISSASSARLSLAVLFLCGLITTAFARNNQTSCASQGKPDEIIKSCTALIERSAKTSENLAIRGRAYHAKGEEDLAIQDFDHAIQLSPKDRKSTRPELQSH